MMSPYRQRRNWVIMVMSLVILAAFVGAAFVYRVRVTDLERIVYQNCVANERQDSIMVSQLQEAMVRVRISLAGDTAEMLRHLEVLGDGIAALEPPDERPCEQLGGTYP